MFEKDAVILERDPRLRAKLLALSGAIVAASVAQMLLIGGPPLGLLLLMVPFSIWVPASTDNRNARSRSARVRVSAEGVAIDGKLSVPASKIADAVLQPHAGANPTVRLFAKDRSVILDIVVAGDDEGKAMLRALGRDASTRKARFATMNPILASPQLMGAVLAGFVAAIAGVFHFAFGFEGERAFLVAGGICVVPLFLLVRFQQVDVGADGLSTSWNGRRRFIAWEDVRNVEAVGPNRLRLVLAAGDPIVFTMTADNDAARATRQRDALWQRIVEAEAAHRARVGPRELASRLAPRARDGDAWLADLRKLREGEGGYRAAAVREEDLWRLVEDPGAPEAARAAAAVLLRKEDGAKPRLRIAADAVASPRLRVALEAEEEEEAEQALRAYLR